LLLPVHLPAGACGPRRRRRRLPLRSIRAAGAARRSRAAATGATSRSRAAARDERRRRKGGGHRRLRCRLHAVAQVVCCVLRRGLRAWLRRRGRLQLTLRDSQRPQLLLLSVRLVAVWLLGVGLLGVCLRLGRLLSGGSRSRSLGRVRLGWSRGLRLPVSLLSIGLLPIGGLLLARSLLLAISLRLPAGLLLLPEGLLPVGLRSNSRLLPWQCRTLRAAGSGGRLRLRRLWPSGSGSALRWRSAHLGRRRLRCLGPSSILLSPRRRCRRRGGSGRRGRRACRLAILKLPAWRRIRTPLLHGCCELLEAGLVDLSQLGIRGLLLLLLLLLLLAYAIAWVQRRTAALRRLRPILLAAAAVSRLLRRRAALRRLQPVLRLPRVALRRRRGCRWPARLLLAAWLLLRRRLLAGRLLLLTWLLVACLLAGRLRGRLLGGPRRDAGLCLVLRGVRSPGQTGTLCGSGRRICRRGSRGRRRRLLQTGWPLLVGLAGRLLRRRQSRWWGRALQ